MNQCVEQGGRERNEWGETVWRQITVLGCLLVATGALGQDGADDWDVTVDSTRNVTAAQLQFSSGLGIAVRCINGRYDAMIGGLPPSPPRSETRPLVLQFGDREATERLWNNTANPSLVVSDLPAPFARQLRRGGRLQIVVPGGGEDGRNVRYVLDLPPSSSAIDQTLTACGRPLTDPRDEEIQAREAGDLPLDFGWARAPRVQFPRGGRYAGGIAVVSCMTQADGSLHDCIVESEYPVDGGFGGAALEAARQARVHNELNPDASVPVRKIVYRAVFRPGGSPFSVGARRSGQ